MSAEQRGRHRERIFRENIIVTLICAPIPDGREGETDRHSRPRQLSPVRGTHEVHKIRRNSAVAEGQIRRRIMGRFRRGVGSLKTAYHFRITTNLIQSQATQD